jgi:hypothetical protein
MKINKQDLLNLKTLFIEKSITFGKFSNKAIVEKLKLNGAIEIQRETPKRQIVHLKKEQNVFNFLQNSGYKIASLQEIDIYIDEILEASPSRAMIQKHHNSTKTKKSDSLKGLYISSLKDIDITLNDEIFTISPRNGLGYFLFYTEKIEIPKDIIIVGIENYQVVWFAKKYLQLFAHDNLLFVQNNPYMRKWISELENEYIHFGDYDLAGINIYLNTIVPNLKKSQKYSMYIPENIEFLIREHGDLKLYQQQIRYKNLIVNDEKINILKEIINKYKKGIEQEGLYLLL